MQYAIELYFNNNNVLFTAHPYEIVRHVSDKTIEIRKMWAERDSSVQVPSECRDILRNWKGQNWKTRSQPDVPTIRIRRHKDGQWYDADGGWYKFHDEPVSFYNFNEPDRISMFRSVFITSMNQA